MKGTVIDHVPDPQKWCVLRVDLDPAEKKEDRRVYGAIWFDREATKNDILRECALNPLDEEVIVILDNGIPDNGNFRHLFALVVAHGMEWVPDIKIGAIFNIVGSLIGEKAGGYGSIECPPKEDEELGESPGASLGFLSEFGYDKDGKLIKL